MTDYTYINSTGVIVPDTSDILTTVQTEFKNALGQDLIVDPSTPQGVLITAETSARSSVINNNAALANQINPNLSAGVFLDAVCGLTGLERSNATYSQVTATCNGVAGTIITKGARAQTANNDVFLAMTTSLIGGGGTVDIVFQAQDSGPVACTSGELNQIIDGILGWETITNSSGATLGIVQQSDQALRILRKVTLAGQGVALPEAIISALYKVDDVKSLTFQENIEATTQVINGITMVAHSIYVCIQGGTNADVGLALLQNKSLGCAWNGDTSVDVVEPYSGRTYTVLFDRPTEIAISVRATVTSTDPLIDATSAVKAAIMAYVNGEIEGENGFVIGQDVSTFELAGAVTTLYPSIYVSNMEIMDDDYTWQNNPIIIGVNEVATLLSSNITVNVS